MDKGAKWIAKKILPIYGKVKQIFDKRPKKDSEKTKAEKEHDEKVQLGLSDLQKEMKTFDKDNDKKLTFEQANQAAKKVKNRHKVFKVLKVKDAEERWDYEYIASPKKIVKGPTKEEKLQELEKDIVY